MMRLFAKLTGGRIGAWAFVLRVAGRPSVSFSSEAHDAIDAALIIEREPDDNGPRVAVISPSLRGSFFFSREEAERRLRLCFPELADSGVERAVRHLESRVRITVSDNSSGRAPRNWANNWKDN